MYALRRGAAQVGGGRIHAPPRETVDTTHQLNLTDARLHRSSATAAHLRPQPMFSQVRADCIVLAHGPPSARPHRVPAHQLSAAD